MLSVNSKYQTYEVIELFIIYWTKNGPIIYGIYNTIFNGSIKVKDSLFNWLHFYQFNSFVIGQ